MNEYLFTYYDQYAKVMLIIETSTMTNAIRIFLARPTSEHINDAISFQVKKVTSWEQR